MEEQHFLSLSLPVFVYPLLSFQHLFYSCLRLPFIASLLHFPLPSSSFDKTPSLVFSLRLNFFPVAFFLCLVLLYFPRLILRYIGLSAAPFVLAFNPLGVSIQLSSHMPVSRMWQTLIRTQQRGCCPGGSVFGEARIQTEPRTARSQKTTAGPRWTVCSAKVICQDKKDNFLSSLDPPPPPPPLFLFRRWHFHKCLTLAISSLRALQSLPLM